MTFGDVQVTLGTNFFGPLLLTQLLLSTLKENAPSRIVWQGSPTEQLAGGVYWDDLTCGPADTYAIQVVVIGNHSAHGPCSTAFHIVPMQVA